MGLVVGIKMLETLWWFNPVVLELFCPTRLDLTLQQTSCRCFWVPNFKSKRRLFKDISLGSSLHHLQLKLLLLCETFESSSFSSSWSAHISQTDVRGLTFVSKSERDNKKSNNFPIIVQKIHLLLQDTSVLKQKCESHSTLQNVNKKTLFLKIRNKS